jgi:hypothetical protein
MSRGRYVSKLHAHIQVLRDVPDRPQTYETLAELNQRSALSAWVFDPATRTVDMHAIAYVNVAVEKQIFAWFSQAATLQAAEAHHHVDALAAALKAAVATSHVPDGPARTIPDDLLGIFAETARRSEAAEAILHEDVFERLEIFEPHPWVLASSSAEGMVAELPWNDIVPAPLSHRASPTALLHVRGNQSHPQLGAGVLATLTLPIAAADGPRLANRLNLAAIEAWNDAHLLGAWCHRDTVAFATFMPGTQWLGRPANEQALLLYNLALNHKALCDWSRELITEADLAPATPVVPASPTTPTTPSVPPAPWVAERTDEDALVAAESAAIETRDDTTEAQGPNGGVPVVEDAGDSSTPNEQAADHASTAAARSATASTATPTAPTMREDLSPYRVTELAPLATSLTFDDPAAQLLVEQQILDVVEAEGPIVAKLVLDRLCEAWGIVPADSTVRGAFEQAVSTLERRHRLQHSASGTLALPHTTLTLVRVPDGDDPRTARTVAQVPPRELRLAIEHVTAEAEQQPLAKDTLCAAVAELFGWPDRSAAIDSALEMALAGLVRDGRVVIDADGGGVRLGT